MTLFKTILFIYFISSLQSSTSVEICSDLCGIQLIRFPFRLIDRPYRCGYPRFNLSCKNQTRTVLSLPFSGEFDVVNIDYMFQNIWINDPDYCAPKRLLRGLNLSGTPFHLLYPRSFMFFNCSGDASIIQLREARYISCLSDTNFPVMAVPADRLDLSTSLLSMSCSKIATVPVPVSWTGWSNLGNGIMLTWNEPNCLVCESRSGNCMFKSDTGLDIGCSGDLDNGLPRHAKYGIMFGVGIPILFILGIVLYLRNKADDHENRHPNHLETLSGPIGPRLQAVAKGLDGQTIEAYPIILIGESGRLPRPNDNTCSICLSEYQAKETLRTIPDCNHYFHADCIDEWLRLNAACPLCRITPEKLVPTLSSSS